MKPETVQTEPRILISACLLGQPVRYDGAAKPLHSEWLAQWRALGWLVPVCPELEGGLVVPRAPAEIQFGGGDDVIAGNARLFTSEDEDVTRAFIQGAERTLQLARRHGCQFALLTARSPSCGNEDIYDGHFTGQLVPGQGVTAALLRQHGIKVFNQYQLAQLARLLEQ